MADYDWSSKDNPELQQKMNEAVDQAVNDYLGKIKSGEISFPNNLQLEIDKIGNKTRHDIIQSQSDQPKIFSETLQEGLDTSNIKQKQKRSREQELLDEMNQTRLSDEDWLEQADARQLMASLGSFGTDANYVDKITMGNELWATPKEGIASIDPHGWEFGNQWQTAEEDDESDNWLANLKKYTMPAYNFMRGNVGAGLMGLVNPLAGLAMFAGGNRGPVINPATRQFMNQYNVGRNPQTGRMIGGPFAGMNAPGTSLLGSKTPQEMAQKWMKQHGTRNYQTESQIAKQKEIRDIAAGNRNLPPSERGRARDHTRTAGIGSPQSKQGHGGSGHVGASRFN